MTSLKGLKVGGATHEKSLMRVGRREREKKKKSGVEEELQPSAAVPCHIFAEHDSGSVWCGNDLGFALQTQTRRCCCMFHADLDVRERAVSEGDAAGCCSARRETGSSTGADRSPPTAGADGTTERNPEDELQLDGISSLIIALSSCSNPSALLTRTWRFVSSFLGLYRFLFFFMVWISPQMLPSV